MKMIYFYLLFALLLCSFAFANNQYTSYGFSGYQFGTEETPKCLWSSNIGETPQRANPFPDTMINQTIDNNFLPLIMNPIKGSDGGLEIYLFNSFSINVYDSNFNNVCQYLLTGWNGTISPIDIPGYNSYLFAYLQKTGTDYNLKIINRSTSCFNEVKSINISDNANYTGSVLGGKNGVAYVWDSSNNLTKIDIITGINTTYAAWIPNMTSCTHPITWKTDAVSDDLNDDGFDDILLIGRTSNNGAKVGIFNTNSNTWTTRGNIASSSNTAGCSVSPIEMGTGSRYIAETHCSTTQCCINILDYGGNIVYNDCDVADVPLFVADIDLDGKNELMFMDDTTGLQMHVKDSSFNEKYTVTNVICASSTEKGNCALALFQASPYMQILSASGVMMINSSLSIGGSSNAFLVKTINGSRFNDPNDTLSSDLSWSFSTSAGFMFPIDVQSSNFKDIFLLSNGLRSSSLILSSTFGAFCGNGLCEIGESTLTCPQDCATQSPTTAVLTSVDINPCYSSVWKENTSVIITAKAETLDNSGINIYSSIDFDSCSKNESFTGISSGSIVNFGFLANCSGNGVITISANSISDPTLNILTFPFSVSPFNGISLGDSSCGVTQPLIAFAQPNVTGNGTNNGLYNGISVITGLTGLSGIIIWLIAMVIVTIAILWGSTQAHLPPFMIMGVIVLVNVLGTIIGSYLRVLPVSFVIIIALSLIVVIGLWFRGMISGSSNSGV